VARACPQIDVALGRERVDLVQLAGSEFEMLERAEVRLDHSFEMVPPCARLQLGASLLLIDAGEAEVGISSAWLAAVEDSLT
jgi:hypothetical protein